MTLTQKLQTIASPKLPSFSAGEATTLEEYWQKFIEPRLPSNIDVVIEWHKVLKEYVKKPDAVLAFRTGNVRGKLRRGWETITNDGYSFFYTDNYFSHYFYKLAHDGDYVPNLEEFFNAMKSKKFPVRISSYMGTADDPHEREYAAFDVDGKNPGLGTAGYKLAHIIDAGRNYFVNNQLLGLSEICNAFFNLGEVSDWKKNPTTNLYCRGNFVITEDNKQLARELAEASFLRMVHPMNYFLSPKSKNAGKTYNEYCINGKIKNNIAEEPLVLDFVKQKFHERYTKNGVDYFKEFLDLVYCKDDFCKVDGKIKIDIHYSALGLPQKRTNAQVSSINRSLNKPVLQNIAGVQMPRFAQASNGMSKSIAIQIARKEGLDVFGQITYASLNKGAYKYWANPNVDYLLNDWWLILNDTQNKMLHVLLVPAGSINHANVVVRADKPELMDLQINYNDNSFTDSRSKIAFDNWLVKSIGY